MAKGSKAAEFSVIGYLPEYRLQTFDLAVASQVTDLIFFSIEPQVTGELNLERLTPEVDKRLGEIRRGQQTRLFVSVGGWGRSAGFGRMATDMQARRQFVDDLAEFCMERGFAGADFDWEFPADGEENGAYAVLLAEVKQVFQPNGLLVTVALGPGQELSGLAYQVVDRVHLMAYDQGTRHSTFEHAVQGVELFLKRGVAAEKLCLGVPFYGRSMEDGDVAMTYADIVRLHRPSPGIDEAGGVYFNGIETIQRKTRHAMECELGGVMIWELGQDVHGEGSLLGAIHRVVEV
jgi:chitinase